VKRPASRSQLGEFWLPGRPEDRLHGVIDIEPGSRPVLRLHGAFDGDRRPIVSPGDVAHETIHGYVQNPGESCSLHGVSFLFPGPNFSSAYVNAVVFGVATTDEAVRRCRYTLPLGLVVPDVNQSSLLRGDEELVARHEARRSRRTEFEVDNARIRISTSATIRYGDAEQTTQYGVTHQVDVVVDDPITWTEIPNALVAPMRDLISLVRGSQPEIGSISFEVEGDSYSRFDESEDGEDPHPRERHPALSRELLFPTWQRGVPLEKPTNRYSLYFPRIVQRFEGMDEVTALTRWWRWAAIETNRDVLRSANRTAGLEQRSGQDEFSDAFSALERYGDRLTPDGRDHRTRCDRIMAFVPDDDPDRQWIENRLRSGGGLGQTAKLRRIRDLHLSGEYLVGDDKAIAERVKVRSLLSHGKPPPPGSNLRHAAQQMREHLIVLALSEHLDPDR
jgi:hypothetical protein